MPGRRHSRADVSASAISRAREQRLRDFLIGRFGGPQRYIEQRGHPRLRMRHMPFAVNAAARERWLQLMTNALDEVRLPADVDSVPP